jgi:hypothetical protein
MMGDPIPLILNSPLVGIVGPCASGKSTLIQLLEKAGVRTRHIAQEHSYVKDMWLRLTHPDILVFLDATYPTTITRRQLNWTQDEYLEQHRRLEHARGHADFYILTDPYTPVEVCSLVIEYLLLRGYVLPARTTG